MITFQELLVCFPVQQEPQCLIVLVIMLISGSKKIRPPRNHMDFVGCMWTFKNPSPDWPENNLTF